AAPRPIRTPSGSVSAAPQNRKVKTSEWMNDFISTHREPTRSFETRLTDLNEIAATAQKAQKAVAKNGSNSKPAWMTAFGQQRAVEKKEAKPNQSQEKSAHAKPAQAQPAQSKPAQSQAKPTQSQPDWMKDFE